MYISNSIHFLFFFFLFFLEFFEEVDTVDCLVIGWFDKSDSKVFNVIGVTASFPKHSILLNRIESLSSSSCCISISSFYMASFLIRSSADNSGC